MIQFDPVTNSFTVHSTDAAAVGLYEIVVSALTPSDNRLNQTITTNFELLVSGTNSTIVEQLPYFEEKLEPQIVLVGESWVYTIPNAEHPNDLTVTYEVDLQQTSIFASYEES